MFYNELGKAERICYPNGSSTVYEYEKGGRLKSVRYPDGAGEHYGYDAKGNLTERTTTAGENYRYNYDSLDRMISVQNPAGGISYFTYDALGRVIKAENESGNQTCYEYTPNGNLAKVTDAMGNETFYQYDAMGHLTQSSCTGAEGEEPQNTVYTWDKEGHVTAVTDPLGDVECYTYDPAGRMKAKIDKDGYETSFHYGKDGQVEEICYADGRTVSLTYNAIRQLEEVRDWLGTTKIAMDEAGHIASVTDPYGKTVGYEWGSMGERTAICYPDGRRAAYEYNEAMQLSALKLLSDDAQEKTILYSYDEAGRLTGKQFPGGNRTDYSYNGAGKIKEILHTGADFTERYHYDYDVMGNKVLAEKERPGLPEDSGNFSYDYDALNRLTSVACNGKTLRTYGYDAFGNRNTRTEYQAAGELVTTYHYNTKNQLTQETNASGTKNYNYDHRGNLLSVTSGEEVLKAYGFDAANRMSSSVDRTAGEITKAYYQYNGLGHRVGQTIASGNADVTQTIRYTLDLTRQYHNLLQKTGNGLDQTYFWDGNVTGMEENGRDHFYFQDDLGSPMRLADEDGRSEEVYGFDEFGNDIRTAKDIFKDSLQSFGFTGYQMDSVGALYFAQARRYDAGVGRFISEDFIKGHIAAPYTMNHYSYCWNRPLDLVDLNGMAPTAGVIKDLEEMYPELEENDNSDLVHDVSDLRTELKNVKQIKECGENSYKWLNQYNQNKSLAKSIIDNPTAKKNAIEAGVSVGNLRRTKRAQIKNGLKEMEKIGDAAKAASRFKVPYFDIAVDVGVGMYDNYQSGASAKEYVSDAVVDVAMTTGETAIASIIASMWAGFIAGSIAPGAGNVIGAIIGLAVGLGIAYFDSSDIDGNGKSVRDDVKDTVYGWINGGNDEKE